MDIKKQWLCSSIVCSLFDFAYLFIFRESDKEFFGLSTVVLINWGLLFFFSYKRNQTAWLTLNMASSFLGFLSAILALVLGTKPLSNIYHNSASLLILCQLFNAQWLFFSFKLRKANQFALAAAALEEDSK